jgi:hypothetical protein
MRAVNHCHCFTVWISRLIDVLFREMQLYLVFEYMECDLKKYMEASAERPECKLGEPLIRVLAWMCSAACPQRYGSLDYGGIAELCVPAASRTGVLSRAPHFAPRSETTEHLD